MKSLMNTLKWGLGATLVTALTFGSATSLAGGKGHKDESPQVQARILEVNTGMEDALVIFGRDFGLDPEGDSMPVVMLGAYPEPLEIEDIEVDEETGIETIMVICPDEEECPSGEFLLTVSHSVPVGDAGGDDDSDSDSDSGRKKTDGDAELRYDEFDLTLMGGEQEA